MSTAVAVRGSDGVAIAVDRRVVEGGEIRSEDVDHLYTSEGLAVATVGPPAAIQACHRDLDAALREYRMEHEGDVYAEAARRIVGRVVGDAGTQALLGVTDRDGQAQLVQFDTAGGAVEESSAVVGEGSAAAVGLLESVQTDATVAELRDTLEELLQTAAERETSIGTTIDTTAVNDRG